MDEILNVRDFVHAFVGTVDHAAGPCDGAGAAEGRAIGYGAGNQDSVVTGKPSSLDISTIWVHFKP